MRKQVSRIAAGVLVLGILAPLALAEDLADVEKKISDAWEKHSSMSAKVSVVGNVKMEEGETKTTGQGTYEMLRKDGKDLIRTEMTTAIVSTIAGQEMKTEQKSLTIVESDFAYSLAEVMGQKMATKTAVTEQHASDPANVFRTLREQFTLKLLPSETVDGQETWVVEATPKDTSQAGGPGRIVIWFRHDGAIAKQVTYDAAGKPLMTVTYSDLKFDVKLDPERFVFKLPDGVQLMDMTQTQPPGTP
jgi:outer membrane lipoprotein-sorting protein